MHVRARRTPQPLLRHHGDAVRPRANARTKNAQVDPTGCRQSCDTHDSALAAARLRQQLREGNEWKNALVLWAVPGAARARLPRLVLTWLRSLILATVTYLVLSAALSYCIYVQFKARLFGAARVPTAAGIVGQIQVAVQAMPAYATMAALIEVVQEQGWTRAYPEVADVGWAYCVSHLVLYVLVAEFGLYCVHRWLHATPWAFRHIHHVHHQYSKEHLLSPFAGLAAHPLESVLSAAPYTAALFLVPVHSRSVDLVLFLSVAWVTSTHDAVHTTVPLMLGTGHHTLHHTQFTKNYGQFFQLFDWLFGTLQSPD